MKLKEVEVVIESLEEAVGEAVDAIKAVKKGGKVKQKEVISFSSLSELKKVLTDERIRLLKAVRKQKPKNILALSKILDRKYANVCKDLKVLEELGLIELEPNNHSVEPRANYSLLRVAIPI